MPRERLLVFELH